MGNHCCFNMKYRNENGEQREIILMKQPNLQEDIKTDLNDSNPLLTKNNLQSSRQGSSRHNSARCNKKNEMNTTLGTTTDPKSIQAYPQNIENITNIDLNKIAPQILSSMRQQAGMQNVNRTSFNEFNEVFMQQTYRPQSTSDKVLDMEKKMQLLENYINEQQQSEQIENSQQPSIVDRIIYDKEGDDKSKEQEMISPSNNRNLEKQYFEQFQFDILFKVVDQMQQTSLRDGSTASLSTSLYQLNTLNVEKPYKTYENGDIYIGNLNDKNQREGFGKLLGENGIYYEGDWVADRFEGRGIYFEHDTTCIKGNFKNGVPHGNCIQVKIIKKPWKEIKKRETFKDHEHENDDWSKKTSLLTINSEFQGCVISKYKGEINNGQKQGNGELVIDKFFRYVGGFAEDKFNGYGICVYTQGTVYEGQWLNDKKEGKGSELWQNGRSYQGEYKNDLFHGYGQLINEDGEIYEGFWYNGEMEGQGILTKADQTSIYGQWQKGVLQSFIPL